MNTEHYPTIMNSIGVWHRPSRAPAASTTARCTQCFAQGPQAAAELVASLAGILPESTRTVDVERFVPAGAVDQLLPGLPGVRRPHWPRGVRGQGDRCY